VSVACLADHFMAAGRERVAHDLSHEGGVVDYQYTGHYSTAPSSLGVSAVSAGVSAGTASGVSAVCAGVSAATASGSSAGVSAALKSSGSPGVASSTASGASSTASGAS